MVVFLANRENLQTRRLHDRIKHRLRGDFSTVRMEIAGRRDPGSYRVVGDVDTRSFLDDDEYGTSSARIEIGFELTTDSSYPYEFYWINWIEPDRDVLVGWHRDDMHDDLGPVHLQVNDGPTPVVHEPAHVIDSHPLDVVDRRLEELPDVVSAVMWDDGRPVGLDTSAL